MKNISTSSDASIATDYVLIIILDDIEHSKTLGVLGTKACLVEEIDAKKRFRKANLKD
ncbi:hypothetical protein BUTYVIB_02398 [Eshraghiella crossota DSM 2876]|uniref:Uncharacterized protein n=1 Tax=Eshraghiella crossota DSM 2876 TaxID=511680 RepID=D4S2S6_9FIRM|nr:hypothetical protein [Butyrivibrio crossotus]EFF67531.1 hypothetical protein BUTYVIB_02398 [Butyrivibrio crossotus DSM 2876]